MMTKDTKEGTLAELFYVSLMHVKDTKKELEEVDVSVW